MEAKVSPETAAKKAELLAGGPVLIEKDFRFPFPASLSTAGPGAGTAALVFSFGGTMAKKEVSREDGEFEVVGSSSHLSVTRWGEPFLDEVSLVPTLMHAPHQAFINIEHECVLDCKFCSSPRLGRSITKNLTDDKIIQMVVEASGREGFRSVAFTSAVTVSRTLTVNRIASLVRKVRALMPDVPIGVEPYVIRPDEIELLRESGADEIKINIESFDRDIFDRVCGKQDYDLILHAINHSCEVFGRNRVCSNIIFGMGETDDNVLEGAKVLANMGAVATLRALRVTEHNRSSLEDAVGPLEPVSPERMLRLAREEKSILQTHGLTPLDFRTMCHACLSCDIVPFWDV